MTKNQFAILYAQESLFWQLCSKNEWPEGLKMKYRTFCNRVKDAIEELDEVFDRTVSGFDPTTSHYDIDKALKNEYGDRVRPDSEANQFFCYCSKRDAIEIIDWLKEKYPNLNSVLSIGSFNSNPWFENWPAAERYCKENGLKVELPEEAKLDQTKMDQLKTIDEAIAQLTAQKEVLLNQL